MEWSFGPHGEHYRHVVLREDALNQPPGTLNTHAALAGFSGLPEHLEAFIAQGFQAAPSPWCAP